MIRDIFGLAVLAVLSVIDMKKRSLPVYMIVVTAVLSAGAWYLSGSNISFPAVVGVIIFLLILYAGKTGMADIAVIGCLFIWQGWVKTSVAVWLGFVACGLLGGILVLLGRVTKKTRLPFIPFLTFGYVIGLFF
ncbi:MAG: prepilin peptidase [Lachnospiraceae bacterium]